MRHIPKILSALLMLALMVTSHAQADLYKWVDSKGTIHYTDSPPSDAQLQTITGKISSFKSVEVEPATTSSASAAVNASKAKPVVMYSTSWCGYCRKARRHFNKQGIKFTEYDIEKSASAARAYKKLNGRGVPVILIGRQRMNGFRASSFDRIYYDKS